MAANRYVGFDYDQPISSHVPLPLDAIYKMGVDASKRYEDTLKDLDSGKDPISKLNTQSIVRVYDSKNQTMTDAPISFERDKSNILNYMNQQKEQIISNYINDKDINKYKQRVSKLKGEVNNAYSDLASKAAIVDQINKENVELSKSAEYGLDPAYATKRLQYNTNYLKNLQDPNIGMQAYAPPAVAKEIKLDEVINRDADHWYKDDLGSTTYTSGNYIHDLSKKGITGTRVYKYIDEAWKQPNHSAKAYAQLQLEHEMNLKGLNYDSEIEYEDYKKNDKGEIIYNKDKQPILETKTGKFGDLFMEEKKREYANMLASKIVHVEKDPNMKVDAFKLHDYKKKLAEENAKDYTNTSSVGNPTATSMQQLLSENGLSELIDIDGNIKSKSAGLVVSPGNSVMPFNITTYKADKSSDHLVNQAFKKSEEVGRKLGLKTPKDGNWVKAVHKHFQNVAIQASTTSDFHPSTANSLTNYFLGENSDISNVEIYPQGSQNKNDKATVEVAKVLAKNSKFSGIDYYSNDNAGLRLTYTPKDSGGNPSDVDQAYIAIPKNKNLLAEAEPVRHISNAYINRMKNPDAYAKAVSENPSAYFQADNDANSRILSKADATFGVGKYNFISSSTELRTASDGRVYKIYRGVVDVEGTPVVLKYSYDGKNENWDKVKSLSATQEDQTHYIETEGSLRQFNTKLQETLKTTEVDTDEN